MPCLTSLRSRTPGARARLGAALTLALALIIGVGACTIDSQPMLSPRDAGVPDAPSSDAPPLDYGFRCTAGQPGCFGNTHYLCAADGVSREEEEVCPDACDPTRGCVFCVAGSRRCDGDVSMVCNAEGTAWLPGRSCGEWSSTCNAATGYCADVCGTAEATRANVGCEYFPVALANTSELRSDLFGFVVVVANPSAEPATVDVTRGGRFVARAVVAPGNLAEMPLPWVDGVSFPFDLNEWQSHVVADGAYRLKSTRPVIVAQFNPFQYASRGQFSFSNDASLLLPAHVLTGRYVGASMPPLSTRMRYPSDATATTYQRYPGYLALIGTSEGATNVVVRPTGHLAADANGRWPATDPGGTVTFTFQRGEVAQLAVAVPPPCDESRPGFVERTSEASAAMLDAACREDAYDLSGSAIEADRPIAVFGGHACADVPYDVRYCDHLEAQLAPVQTWSTAFDTAPMRDPGRPEPNLLRVIASVDGTRVTLDPAQRGVSTLTLDAGAHAELLIDGALHLEASEPVQIVQLMVGQAWSPVESRATRGDPGMTTLVPREQHRASYVFATPNSYTPLVNGQSYLLITRPIGLALTLDDAPLSATWDTVGDRELATVPLAGGTHRLSARDSFGVTVFGVGSYTSYAYPAGLDLRLLLQ